MPPYLRRRFLGWDWFTPREVQHVPWREQERLIQEVQEVAARDPRDRLFRWLFLLGCVALGLALLGSQLLEKSLPSLFFVLLCNLVSLVLIVTMIVWQRRRFREALQQKLLDAGIRPAFCFKCGYDLEGNEASACPACSTRLLRQANSLPEST
jgi:hypothetical protein